jgi:hypothetical protein
VRLNAPIDLKIFEGDKVLGSSRDATPIALTPGLHKLDVVNAELGYRSQQSVMVRAGESVAVKVAVPDGLISVNAQPWANCTLDKKEIGETPLANLKVALGEHELLCRHPKLGEQKQTIVVKANEVTKVGLKFNQ